MYYKNECLRKTDERIKTLVAKGDIKGLASLAAELQADAVDKMYFIDAMTGTLIEMFSIDDVTRVLEHTFTEQSFVAQTSVTQTSVKQTLVIRAFVLQTFAMQTSVTRNSIMLTSALRALAKPTIRLSV